MKPFNFFILVFLLIILGGSVLFKDGFVNFTNQITTSEASQPQVLYDRLNYLDYSKQNFVSSKKFGKTLLFFTATTWCSNCKAIDEEIKKRNAELPKDITILKVDYDNDREMKAKYGVTMQTTLVLLDSNGNEVKRWIGTNFDDLLENLK